MKIAIHHHLGLGDHFICNGLVRKIQDIYNTTVIIPSKRPFYGTVKAMYADNTSIEVMPFDRDADIEFPQSDYWKTADRCFRVGHERIRFPDWDVSFYDCIDLPYSVRWSYFRVQRDIEREAKLIEKLQITTPFVLFHKNSGNGSWDLNISTPLRKIEVTPLTDNLIDWFGVIDLASEIHCIDSSFMGFCSKC